jgi:hemolysin III
MAAMMASQLESVRAARAQGSGEEIANALSHGLAFLLAVAALPVLVVFAVRRGGASDIAAAAVFGASMMLLYGVSTLYHALPPGRAKRWFHRLDHAAIYVFIAGSYTPFALGALRGAWGWTLFGIVWSLAAAGVTIKLFNRLRHPLWSTGLYVAMGWVVLIAVVPLVQRMPGTALAWLVAGGLAYTLGAVVYLFDHRLRYVHFAWHLFVMVGSACHLVAALAQFD